MSVFWTNLLFVIIGFIFGIVASKVERSWKRKDQKEYAEKVLKAIQMEIEEGLNRCRTLIKMKEESKIFLVKKREISIAVRP